MRKFLLILLLLIPGIRQGFAAGNYNLQFSDSLVLPNDTAHIGSSYTLYVYITNEGPDSFSGDIVFRAYVTTKQDLDKSSPKYTFIIDSSSTNHYVIPPHGKATYVKSITFTKTFFIEDSTNIVIIWPSGSAKPSATLLVDNDPSDNFANPFLVFYVSGAAAKTFSAGTSSSSAGTNGLTSASPPPISYYPNPGSSTVNVMLDAPARGLLRLMDLDGKTINQIDVNSNLNLYSVDLTYCQKNLPNGIYLLRYESSAYGVVTRKLIISR